MLIISKKKDYYDGVVTTTGIDKSIVYNRNPIIVNEKEYPIEFTVKNWKDRNIYLDIAYIKINTDIEQYIDICPFIVFFCAETHIGFKLYKKINHLI